MKVTSYNYKPVATVAEQSARVLSMAIASPPALLDPRHAVSTIGEAITPLQVWPGENDSLAIEFDAPRGLYQWSVIADGREFDWEKLYVTLNEWGNTGQRTGPWDFPAGSKSMGRPAVPSYWVEIDGKRIGLWFFQRVPVHDIAPRRFRGRMAFFLREGGRHRLVFTPYQPTPIRWISATLENDPEDRFVAPPSSLKKAADACPSARWADAEIWQEFRRKLETTHAAFAPAFARHVEAACAKEQNDSTDIPLLVYTYRAAGKTEALRRAIAAIENQIAKPHWGNPAEDGYSHNGDKHAARPLRSLANAWHMLRDEIGEPLRARLRDKLKLQGERYLDLALLNRDYWGGSLLQDHGWNPNWAYANAALMLYGEIPEAADWVAWAMPRMRRALASIPRDGAIPQTQWGSPHLQVQEHSQCRDTFLTMSGEDLYDESPLPRMIDYLCQTVRPETRGTVVALDGRDDASIGGGTNFFHAIAAKHRDGRAAWLGQLMLEPIAQKPKWLLAQDPDATDLLWAFVAHDPGVVETPPKRSKHSLMHFEDSALVHFRDFEQDITFSLRCGPPHGYHAHRHARGPCDRLGFTPRWGHFCFYRGTSSLLGTPASGYALRTNLGSCLLIDGHGQREDVGYPMSLPSSPYYGQEIEAVEWDEANESGLVRLNLTPAYPDSLGVISYRREFLIRPNERTLICRDLIALDRPSHLAWLFQSPTDVNPRIDGKLLRLGDGSHSATIEPRTHALSIEASMRPTEVVQSYSTDSRRFVHARYDAAPKTDAAAVDFVIRW